MAKKSVFYIVKVKIPLKSRFPFLNGNPGDANKRQNDNNTSALHLIYTLLNRNKRLHSILPQS